MILQSLVQYYEILANDEESDISRPGYSKANVSYALNLSLQGELLEVIPLKIKAQRGKKIVEIPQRMNVPEGVKKSVNIASNFLCENSGYTLGIDNKGKPERAKECFHAFQELHNELLEGVDCDEATAMANFVNHWNPDKALEHPALADYLDEILAGANLVFKLDGGSFIHQTEKIKQKWEEHKSTAQNESVMQCLITGKPSAIARLHPSIKGVKGAQSAGASIISFNDRAYESYGREKQQGLNAPVSEYAAFAYTTVLNSMLADSAHKISLGDTTVVFWAQSPDHIYQEMAALFLDPSETESQTEEKTESVRDENAVSEVKAILEKIAQGRPAAHNSGQFDPKVSFCMLGLAPNAARLAVRFFIQDSFGGFIEKMEAHYQDMRIEKQYSKEPNAFSLWRLLNETVSPKSSEKSASPLLAGSVLRSIMNGLAYPTTLFQAIMIRIKAEKDINYYKAAAIKAYLLRNKNNEKYKEVLVMGLNEQSDNRAYILGRLFAVLEKAQLDASPGLQATIKDRYFTSACATPASVFPILFKLSQYHMSKAEYGYASDRKIADIIDRLNMDQNPIPAHLSLDEQGIFVLGYYHQRNANYKKNNHDKENEQ